MLCVLLLLWNKKLQYGQARLRGYAANRRCPQDYKFVEHYAGSGEVTRAASEHYGTSVKLDKAYHRSMDILQPSGFANFGLNCVRPSVCGSAAI